MQILYVSLMILSGLLGIVVGGLGVMLGIVFQYSPASSDQIWSWIIICCSVLYLCHPALLYWLFKNSHYILVAGLSTLFIVLSGTLTFFLLSAIEAGARP